MYNARSFLLETQICKVAYKFELQSEWYFDDTFLKV